MNKNKLVVVGVGHVGSYVLADAMKTGLFAEIGVIDILQNVAYGEALDQAQATALTYMNNVDVRAGGYEQCADADVIIVVSPVRLSTMGRELDEDEAAFIASAVAGRYAAGLIG